MVRLLSKPVSQSFDLGDFTVAFHQLTEGDRIALGDLEAKRDLLYNEDGSFRGIHSERNQLREERHAVYKTMDACTLQWEDTGDALFDSKDGYVKKSMSENSFNKAWDMLPPEIANKIVEKYYEVNPLKTPGE